MTVVDTRSPCRMIWDLAGRPDPAEPAKGEGLCALCGIDGPLHGKVGNNFTDYRRLAVLTSTRLCAACTWALSGKPPATLRMWTIVARTDQAAPPSQPTAHAHGEHLHATNRKDMRWVAATLADPPADGSPWLVTVAESGQKHTAPFATINHGTGLWTVCLDGTDITSTPDEWRMLLGHCAALRVARLPAKPGKDPAVRFSTAAVETGEPAIPALSGEGLELWRTHAPHLRPYLHTPLLHLANLMITKETVDDFARNYPT